MTDTMPRLWVRSYTDRLEYVEHLNGVDWFDAPPPSRLHRCSPQTRGRILGGFVERCACGAMRMDRSGPWIERNQRSAVEPARRGWLARWWGRKHS